MSKDRIWLRVSIYDAQCIHTEILSVIPMIVAFTDLKCFVGQLMLYIKKNGFLTTGNNKAWVVFFNLFKLNFFFFNARWGWKPEVWVSCIYTDFMPPRYFYQAIRTLHLQYTYKTKGVRNSKVPLSKWVWGESRIANGQKLGGLTGTWISESVLSLLCAFQYRWPWKR